MNLNIYISIICLKTKKTFTLPNGKVERTRRKEKKKEIFQLFIDEREKNKRRKKAVLNRWIGDR